MSNLKLKIAYEGTHYFGWQKTATGPSIEQTLQSALEQILRRPIQLQAASRTDLGVHANGQIVNFAFPDTIDDLHRLHYACNCLLPSDIRILSIEEVLDRFHPTLDCIGKEYHYHLCNTGVQLPQHRLYSWHVPHLIQLPAMREAAKHLIGEHDFKAFCNTRKNMVYDSYVRHVTKIELIIMPENRLRFAIAGNHFLYKMVRNLVGTLVYVGLGKIGVPDIIEILRSGSRPLAGITAPAHGLFLDTVRYAAAIQQGPSE